MPNRSRKKREKKTGRRIVRWLSIAYLTLVFAYLVLLFGVSERWWLGVLATYSPRVLVLLPSLLLIPLSLFFDRWSAMLSSIAVVLIVFVGMEFNIPTGAKRLQSGESAKRIFRVASCNVQRFRPDFPAVLAEILAVERDLIVFQEALGTYPESLVKALPDWHFVSDTEYQIASRFPARVAGHCRTSGFNRVSVVAFKMLNEYQARRISVNQEMRSFVEELRQKRPVIIAGDFNVPVSSNLFKNAWDGYSDAFSATEWGYGYTAPCDGPARMPVGWPWIRIDHILVDDNWEVISAEAGKSNGSDHRIMSAELDRRIPSG